MKTSPILYQASVDVHRLWRKACVAEGIPVDSMFVVFSEKHATLNAATLRLLTLKAIQRTFQVAEEKLIESDDCQEGSFSSVQHAYDVAMKEVF